MGGNSFWWELRRNFPTVSVPPSQRPVSLNKPVGADLFPAEPLGAGPRGPHPAWLALILAFFASGRFTLPFLRLCLGAVPHLLEHFLGEQSFVPVVFVATLVDFFLVLWWD